MLSSHNYLEKVLEGEESVLGNLLGGGKSGSVAVAFAVKLHHLEGSRTGTGDRLGTSASPGPPSCFAALAEVPIPPSPTKHPWSGFHLWEMLTPMVETTEAAACSSMETRATGLQSTAGLCRRPSTSTSAWRDRDTAPTHSLSLFSSTPLLPSSWPPSVQGPSGGAAPSAVAGWCGTSSQPAPRPWVCGPAGW